MFNRIHQKLGTASFIISIVALVAALGGGAYAASGGLSGKQKKEVEKIAKKYAGKPGTNGTNGTNGAKGDTGAAGTNGTNGTNGSPGGPGASGKSIESRSIAKGEPAQCNGSGGVELEVEGSGSPSEICNGQPWNPAGLPKGATETGTWSLNASEASASSGDRVLIPLSFPIPLGEAIEGAANVHFVGEVGDATCRGTYTHPTAPEGMICVYHTEVVNARFAGVESVEQELNEVNPTGGFLKFNEVKDHAEAWGSFAVTGG
jgi:Collagen triple helix repeat (20 copies)